MSEHAARGGLAVLALVATTLVVGCGGKKPTTAEKVLDATDSIGDCTFVEQVCDVDLSRDGKQLSITLQDGSRLILSAIYFQPSGSTVDDCFDDASISDGDWIGESSRKGDVFMSLPLTPCGS
jgi:hypothetical protein